MVDSVTIKPEDANAGGDPVAAARAIDTKGLNPPPQIEPEPVPPALDADAQGAPVPAVPEAPAQPAEVPQAERQAGETARLKETIESDRQRQYAILADVDRQIDDATRRKSQMDAAISATQDTLAKAVTQSDEAARDIVTLHNEREQITGRITKYSSMLVDAESAELKRPRT